MATFYEEYEEECRPIPKSKEEVKRESMMLTLNGGGGFLYPLQRWDLTLILAREVVVAQVVEP